MNSIARDWKTAPISEVDRNLCAYAEKVSALPAALGQGDVDALRSCGLSDRAIHDATQVISYFNYINRIADALGIENEDFVRAWGDLDLE